MPERLRRQRGGLAVTQNTIIREGGCRELVTLSRIPAVPGWLPNSARTAAVKMTTRDYRELGIAGLTARIHRDFDLRRYRFHGLHQYLLR